MRNIHKKKLRISTTVYWWIFLKKLKKIELMWLGDILIVMCVLVPPPEPTPGQARAASSPQEIYLSPVTHSLLLLIGCLHSFWVILLNSPLQVLYTAGWLLIA